MNMEELNIKNPNTIYEKEDIIEKYQKEYIAGNKEEYQLFLKNNPIIKEKLILDEVRNILATIGKKLKGLNKDDVKLQLERWRLLAFHIVNSCYTESPSYDQDYEDYINNIPISRK